MKLSKDAALTWKASSPEKRKVLVAFVLQGGGKPVSYSVLWEAAEPYFGKRTFDVYLRALVEDHVLLQALMEGFKRRKGFVVSKAYRKYSDDIYVLLAWQEDVKLFDLELKAIQSQLEETRYGRGMPKDKREQLIVKALQSAYRAYIPSHLALVSECTFFSQDPVHAPLARVALGEYTDRFLSFAGRLRSQVPVETFAIANHAVWGEDQRFGALPKLIGKMWFERRAWQKQFRVSEAKLKKKGFRIPRTDLERMNYESEITNTLKHLLGDLEMKLGHLPTKKEYIDELRKNFPEPERLLKMLIHEQLIFEPEPGFITWKETA